MTVAELTKVLQDMPQDAVVVTYQVGPDYMCEVEYVLLQTTDSNEVFVVI